MDLPRVANLKGPRLAAAGLVIWGFSGLAACQDDADPALADLPPGSVRSGEDEFMVPTGGPDADGCQAYRIHAPGRAVIQIVYYRKADGSFTPHKPEAACMETASKD